MKSRLALQESDGATNYSYNPGNQVLHMPTASPDNDCVALTVFFGKKAADQIDGFVDSEFFEERTAGLTEWSAATIAEFRDGLPCSSSLKSSFAV
jgi:hypothetical protein